MKRLLLLVLFCAGSVHGQECIDSDGDGWGWDGSKSCRVAATVPDACDYTNAGASGGWGLNPVSGASCPPIGIQDDEPETGLIVGEWACQEELFDGTLWQPDLITYQYEGVTIDGGLSRATIDSNTITWEIGFCQAVRHV